MAGHSGNLYGMRKYTVPLLLLLGCVVFFSFNLSDLGLLKGDENFYFSSARRMIREGDWITPRYHHHIRFEKPPFYYWMVAVFFQIFGVSWFTARFTSVLMASLTVLLTYLLGLRLLSRREALLSSVILATSFLFFWYARTTVTDITFLFLVTLGLFLFIKGDQDGKKWPLFLSFAPLGLSAMTKGPIGLIVAALITGIYIFKGKKFSLLRGWQAVLGIILLLAIILPWPIAMYRIHGHEYISHIWEVEAVDKSVGSLLKLDRLQEIPAFAVEYLGYYIPVVLFAFTPWSLFLPFAMKRKAGTVSEGYTFIRAWFWSVFIFFTLASFKHTHYMLLLSPALAMMIGSLFASFGPKAGISRFFRALAALTVAFYITLVGVIMPRLSDDTLKSFSLKLASRMQVQDEEIGLVSRGFNLKKLGLYLNNLVATPYQLGGDDLAQYRRVSAESAADFLRSEDRVYVLITKEDYERYIPANLRGRLHILETDTMWKKFNFKRYLLAAVRQDWLALKQEAYLVSNRR